MLAAVIPAPRSFGRPNGTVYSDSGDIDFSASVFNATIMNPYNNRINGSNDLYVLQQVLAGMDGGHGYVVGVNVTSQVRDSRAWNKWGGGCEKNLRSVRLVSAAARGAGNCGCEAVRAGWQPRACKVGILRTGARWVADPLLARRLRLSLDRGCRPA